MTKGSGLGIDPGGNVTGTALILATVVRVLAGADIVLAGKRRKEEQTSI